MTSETDNKVEAAVERARALLRGDFGAWDDDYVLDVLKGVISDRDRLAAEVERLNKVASNGMTTLGLLCGWDAANKRAEAAKAKLSALVETAKPFARWIESARGAPWRAGPVLTSNDGAVITVADFDAIRQALASLDRTAPGGPEPVVLFPEDGVEYGGLYVSEPAQEVAGLVPGDLEWLQRLKWPIQRGRRPPFASMERDNARIDRILTALSSSPSQGGETVDRSGVAAADNNHKALAEGVLQVQSDLQMLARACQENDPKAEIAIRISDALDVIQDRIAPLLTAFQSRKEESR